MNKKVKQFLCGLTSHKFKSDDTDCKYDSVNKTYTITETCYKCGKKFSFTAPSKNFGLRENNFDCNFSHDTTNKFNERSINLNEEKEETKSQNEEIELGRRVLF